MKSEKWENTNNSSCVLTSSEKVNSNFDVQLHEPALNKKKNLGPSSDSVGNVKKYGRKSSDTTRDDTYLSKKMKTKICSELPITNEGDKSIVSNSDEDGQADNTPQSLKKKKKPKKKKEKTNVVKIQPNSANLDYLKKWKYDRSNWKFEKVKQIRLVSNMFEKEKLPDDYFDIFLEYMAGASKSMRELMSKSANEVVDEMEKWESLSKEEKESTPKVDVNKYERARNILQILQ